MAPRPWIENQTLFEQYGRTHDLSFVRQHLESGGSPNVYFGLTSLLHQAAGAGDVESVKLLLAHGADPDGIPDLEAPVPPLRQAAACDSVEIVRLLLEAGANVDVQDLQGDTAILAARQRDNVAMAQLLLDADADPTLENAGRVNALTCGPRYVKTDRVGELLRSRGFSTEEDSSKSAVPGSSEGSSVDSSNPFQRLREMKTNGGNYDVTNEDVVARLQGWNELYRIAISDVSHNSVRVTFLSLPDPVEPLADEINKFCPDVISQGFGCFAEMYDELLHNRDELPREVAELVDGVDFDDENYGMEILVRALRRDKTVMLWWD